MCLALQLEQFKLIISLFYNTKRLTNYTSLFAHALFLHFPNLCLGLTGLRGI